MKSTMDATLYKAGDTWSVVPKEYPDWYGIEGIGFIFINTWADPLLEYNGKQVNSVAVEELMWDDYNEWCREAGLPIKEDEFGNYMRNNEDTVKEIITSMRGEV